jgi:predicted lipoprotein
MNKFAWLVSSLMMFGAASPALAIDQALARQVMVKAVDGYIRPAYADFHAKASALADETARLCSAPSDDGFKAMSARFGDLVESWGKASIITDGPVMRQNRFERVLFYPDRKSIGLKQVRALLATPDEKVTDPRGLRGRSVAIQGLGAFEYVFFGAYPESMMAEKNSFRCRYGLAIARNVAGIAAQLQAAWDDPKGVADDWKNPSKDSAAYRTGEEAMQALIGIHVHGIEMVRDQRFRPFYDANSGKMAPNAAIFRRSGNTIRMMTANVEGLEMLWKVADLGVFLPQDQKAFSGNVVFDYNAAATAIGKLPAPTADNLTDKKYQAKLAFIDFTLKDATARINNDVGAAVGLEAGFSFADGD